VLCGRSEKVVHALENRVGHIPEGSRRIDRVNSTLKLEIEDFYSSVLSVVGFCWRRWRAG